jgi:inosine-uridine nucleoside N-ribohydrolase
MKQLFFIFLIAMVASSACRENSQNHSYQSCRIIFDTDMGPDYDDVGALAFLHAMADSGKAEILATVASNRHKLVAPTIEIINSYFGRADIPLGAPRSQGVNMGASQHWPDSLIIKYPHKINSTDEVRDAVSVYRKILASQPDTSVTIVTVGFLTNLANLLKSQSDSLSPLTGEELVAKKVKKLISMAGAFPEGKEFNIFMDSISSEYVFNEWPGKIVFTGFETGVKIHTGLRLISSEISNSPVKDAFRIAISCSKEDMNGRMSWDQTAVLIAIYGTDRFFDLKRGNIIVNQDGSNRWEENAAGKQEYVVLKSPVAEISKFIEERMMHIPISKNR